MDATTLFYLLVGIIVTNFIIDKIVTILNTRHYNDQIPVELADVYDENEYQKSQAYKKKNTYFSNISSLFSIILTLFFFFMEGFKLVDNFSESYTAHPILSALIFFGVLMIGSSLLTIPFSYYKTFVIEESFGFNKSTRSLFWIDTIKGLIITFFFRRGNTNNDSLFFSNFRRKFLGVCLGFNGNICPSYESFLCEINCAPIQQTNPFRKW